MPANSLVGECHGKKNANRKCTNTTSRKSIEGTKGMVGEKKKRKKEIQRGIGRGNSR